MPNLNKDKMNRYGMAFGPRAMQEGNFAAGARKFRLVDIDSGSTPKIAKIKDDINSTYSDDGGQLYFLFAAENRYTADMDVNDDRTLKKMIEEKVARENFVNCIELRDMEDFSDEEEAQALTMSKIKYSLAESAIADDIGLIDSPERREYAVKNMVKQIDNYPLVLLETNFKTSQNANLFDQFYTNDKSRSIPMRFSLNIKKLNDLGMDFTGEGWLDVYNTYKLYTQSADYHPEVAGKGEIQMLDESISKMQNSEEKKYNPSTFIDQKIEEIEDEGKKNRMKWAWALVKKLKLPLQYPSWVAISWPQGNTRRLNLQGGNHGDNQTVENFEDIAFTDEESGRKMVWRGKRMQPAQGSGDLKLPVTPHATLMQIIGKKPTESGNDKSVEYIKKKLRNQIETATKSKDVRKGKHWQRAKDLRKILTYHEMIRDNMNEYDHRDERSFFYLYDEICHLYFSYNREKYGDGIMLQYSAFYDDGQYRVISPDRQHLAGRVNRPFIPTTLHDDLREVVISVHYAYGAEIPQFASTMFPGSASLLMDEGMLEKIVQKASDRGLKKLTVEDNQLIEKQIPTEELIDFFSKMANGGVLVYRVRTEVDTNTNEEKSNIVWYTGMRSFTDRFDEKLGVTRNVYDEDEGIIQIEGYGKSRISTGKSAVSSDFKERLAILQAYGQSEGSLSVPQWEDIHVDNDLMSVYRYANSKWGLDYDYSSLESMSAKKIKSISPNIIKEMSTSSENGIKKEIKKNETKNKTVITITENTQDLVREIVSEIAQESLSEQQQIEQQNQEHQQIEQQIIEEPAEEMVEDTVVDMETYQPSDEDMQQHKQYQFLSSMMGGVALKPDQVVSLQQKGYILEQLPNKTYRIVQSPNWAVESPVPQ